MTTEEDVSPRLAKVGPGRLEWRNSSLVGGKTHIVTSSLYGYIVTRTASYRIASVVWRGGSKPYVVATVLPGFTDDRRVKEIAEGKLLAEKLLVAFVKMVGADFP
jgi:hypothetical protein